MNKITVFFTGLLMTAFRHIGSIIFSVVMIIVGVLWSKPCLYVGLFLIVSNVVVALVGAIRMQRIVNGLSDNESQINEFIETQMKNKMLHGEKLLALSDDEIFDAVDNQNFDIEEEAEDEKVLDSFVGARRTVYVLNLFDAEVQNGGLCQFFVNSSRAVAPFVSRALSDVGAEEHLKLFDEFIASNNIDVCDLESFKVFSIRGYRKQTKRYDFESFDEKYYELPALQEKTVAYIKAHIDEF